MRKYLLIILFCFIGVNLFGQDTVYTIKAVVYFPMAMTKFNEEITVSSRKGTITSVFSRLEYIKTDEISQWKTVKKKTVKAKKNKQQLFKSLGWLTAHQTDTIMFIDISRINWDTLKTVAKSLSWSTIKTDEADIDKFKQGQNGRLTIENNRFCVPYFEGHVIDGRPFEIIIKNNLNPVDSFYLKDNCYSESSSISNYRNWLILNSISFQTDLIPQMTFLNDYFKSNKILYQLLTRYIYWKKTGCT